MPFYMRRWSVLGVEAKKKVACFPLALPDGSAQKWRSFGSSALSPVREGSRLLFVFDDLLEGL
jgi:hypothetical protein